MIFYQHQPLLATLLTPLIIQFNKLVVIVVVNGSNVTLVEISKLGKD